MRSIRIKHKRGIVQNASKQSNVSNFKYLSYEKSILIENSGTHAVYL